MKHLLFYQKNGNVYLLKIVSEALLKYACKAPFETSKLSFSKLIFQFPQMTPFSLLQMYNFGCRMMPKTSFKKLLGPPAV